MKIDTSYLGEIEFEKDDILTFDEGIYGFGGMREFIFINNPEEDLPFHWLQSIEDQRLSFIVASPFTFVPGYNFEIKDSILEKMELEKPEDLLIYTITVITEEIEEATINLKAPIIINMSNRKSKQIILDEDYPYKYGIFSKPDEEEAKDDASTK